MQIHLIVKPNARKNQLQIDSMGNIKASIKAPPVEGKANKELLRFLSEIFNLPKSSIQIVSGESGKHKKLNIHADEKYIASVLAKCSR